MTEISRPILAADKPLYSVQEAADLMQLSRKTLYSQIAAGDLRALRVGARRIIRRDDLEAFLSRKP